MFQSGKIFFNLINSFNISLSTSLLAVSCHFLIWKSHSFNCICELHWWEVNFFCTFKHYSVVFTCMVSDKCNWYHSYFSIDNISFYFVAKFFHFGVMCVCVCVCVCVHEIYLAQRIVSPTRWTRVWANYRW